MVDVYTTANQPIMLKSGGFNCRHELSDANLVHDSSASLEILSNYSTSYTDINADFCSLSSIPFECNVTGVETNDTSEENRTLRDNEEPTLSFISDEICEDRRHNSINSNESNFLSLREEGDPISNISSQARKEDSGIATWSYEGKLSGNYWIVYCFIE